MIFRKLVKELTQFVVIRKSQIPPMLQSDTARMARLHQIIRHDIQEQERKIPKWVQFEHAYRYEMALMSITHPVIATSYNWWKACTYGYSGFSSYGIPLWIINPGGSSPTSLGLPTGWTTWVIWQAAVGSPTPYVPYNKDLFNGAASALAAFAG